MSDMPAEDFPVFDPTEKPDQELRIERVFAAPRALVWRAFTDPDEFAQWFGPVGYHCPRESLVVEARTGGEHSYTMTRDGDPEGSRATGTFTEVVDGELLVAELMVDGMPGSDGPQPAWLRVEFHDEGAGTRVVITQGPFTGFMTRMATMGWESSFTKLEPLLAA
jgi:uncharacterized protein YndB with AHSA1/START domain